jgi:hypothetical protein
MTRASQPVVLHADTLGIGTGAPSLRFLQAWLLLRLSVCK